MTDPLLYLGTESGLRVTASEEGALDPVARCLDGEAVRAIAVHPEDPETAYVGCGLRGRGLSRVTGAGQTVESLGFGDVWVWGVAVDPADPETIYVGTEPPALHVSRDGGGTFDSFDDLDDLPSRPDWTFFHAPFHAGHVHGIALHPERPARILAGVEHGALVASFDGGDTWAEALVGHDVHRVEVDPDDPDRVLAGAGEGLFESRDGGRSWEAVRPLEGTYVHGIAFDPHVDGRLFAYAADEPTPVFRSEDDGSSWAGLAPDLPGARPADPLVVHPTAPDTLLYAGDEGDGSTLFESRDAGESWTRVREGVPKVWRLAIARD